MNAKASDLRRTLLFTLPAALLVLAYYLHKVGIDDLWWHLRTGRWIWEHRAIPHEDPFSLVAGGERWIDFEWLYQVFVHALFGAGGLPLVTVVHGALAGLALLLVSRAEPAATPRAAALAASIAGAAQFVYPWSRPHVFTQTGVALYLLLLRRDASLTVARMTLLLATQVLWVNLHGGYALGLFILFAFAVERTLDRRTVGRAWALFGAAAAATLANPCGIRLIAHGIGELRSNYATSFIREWVSPLALQGNPATAVVLSIIALLIVSSYFGNGPQRPLLWLVAIGFGLLALRSVRFVSLFALVAVPFLAENFTAMAARWASPWRDRARRALPCVLLASAAFGIWMTWTGRLYAVTRSDLHPGFGIDADGVPRDACDFFLRHELEGPIFHIYDDGSYLIWRLHPRERVLIDPRSALYGDERLHAVRATLERPQAFYTLDARLSFQAALIPHNAAPYRKIIAMLRADPHWRLVHGDARACLFIRADGPNGPRAREWRGVPGPPAGYEFEPPSALPRRSAWMDFWRLAPDAEMHRHYGWANLYQVTGNSALQLMHTREFLRRMPAYHWRYAPMQQWYGQQFATLGAGS